MTSEPTPDPSSASPLSSGPVSPGPRHSERLRVPLRWWALLVMFLAAVLLAFLVALPPWLALGAVGAMALVAGALLVGYGRARVAVADGELTAGRAHVPVALLGVPVALDAADSRRAAGVDADARAYLLLRPYLDRAVRVPVEDPADPTPYWLISTRRPDALVAAVRAEQAAGRRRGGEPSR